MTRVFSPRIVQNEPSAASSRTTDHGSGSGERLAQRVGEVVLLDRQLAHRLDLAARPQVVAERAARTPQAHASWASRAVGLLAGLDELQPAELAHRLEHPVAHRAAGVEHGEQRLVDERAHVVERVVTEHGIRAVEREAVVEDRQPAQRATLGVAQQVPRPVDDREQGLVPVGRGAVAAAQQREPVVEPPVDVLDRHRAHPGGRELDGQRQAVEAAHDAAARSSGSRRTPGRAAAGPLAEQLGCRVVVELGEREDPLGGDRQRRPGGGDHAQAAGRTPPGRPPGRRPPRPRARSCRGSSRVGAAAELLRDPARARRCAARA